MRAHKLRRRLLGVFGMATYAVALWLPLAHAWRHAADHTHALGGAQSLALYAGPITVERAHADFDADLLALELSDAGHLGVMEVDCSLAAYTLAECPEGEATRPHTFGDELLAHQHEHSHAPGPLDPDHGRGSALHLGAALLASSLFVLPAPALDPVNVKSVVIHETPGHAPDRSPLARGPPLAAA